MSRTLYRFAVPCQTCGDVLVWSWDVPTGCPNDSTHEIGMPAIVLAAYPWVILNDGEKPWVLRVEGGKLKLEPFAEE